MARDPFTPHTCGMPETMCQASSQAATRGGTRCEEVWGTDDSAALGLSTNETETSRELCCCCCCCCSVAVDIRSLHAAQASGARLAAVQVDSSATASQQTGPTWASEKVWTKWV